MSKNNKRTTLSSSRSHHKQNGEDQDDGNVSRDANESKGNNKRPKLQSSSSSSSISTTLVTSKQQQHHHQKQSYISSLSSSSDSKTINQPPSLFIYFDKQDNNKLKMTTHMRTWLLSMVDCFVAFIALIGKMRTGKSLLAGMLKGSKDFKVSPLSIACTKGIHLSTEPFSQTVRDAKNYRDTPTMMFIIDTEGSDAPRDASAKDDAIIMQIVTLIASVLIYNVKAPLDNTNIQTMTPVFQTTMDVQITKDKKVRDLSEHERQEFLPNMYVVLQQATLRMTMMDGKTTATSMDQYLDELLRGNPAGKVILDFFPQDKIRCLKIPAISESSSDFERVEEDIPFLYPRTEEEKAAAEQHEWVTRQEYREVIHDFREKLQHVTKAKTVLGTMLSGPAFVRFIDSILDSFNNGDVPVVGSYMDLLNESQARTAEQRSIKRVSELAQNSFQKFGIQPIELPIGYLEDDHTHDNENTGGLMDTSTQNGQSDGRDGEVQHSMQYLVQSFDPDYIIQHERPAKGVKMSSDVVIRNCYNDDLLSIATKFLYEIDRLQPTVKEVCIKRWVKACNFFVRSLRVTNWKTMTRAYSNDIRKETLALFKKWQESSSLVAVSSSISNPIKSSLQSLQSPLPPSSSSSASSLSSPLGTNNTNGINDASHQDMMNSKTTTSQVEMMSNEGMSNGDGVSHTLSSGVIGEGIGEGLRQALLNKLQPIHDKYRGWFYEDSSTKTLAATSSTLQSSSSSSSPTTLILSESRRVLNRIEFLNPLLGLFVYERAKTVIQSFVCGLLLDQLMLLQGQQRDHLLRYKELEHALEQEKVQFQNHLITLETEWKTQQTELLEKRRQEEEEARRVLTEETETKIKQNNKEKEEVKRQLEIIENQLKLANTQLVKSSENIRQLESSKTTQEEDYKKFKASMQDRYNTLNMKHTTQSSEFNKLKNHSSSIERTLEDCKQQLEGKIQENTMIQDLMHQRLIDLEVRSRQEYDVLKLAKDQLTERLNELKCDNIAQETTIKHLKEQALDREQTHAGELKVIKEKHVQELDHHQTEIQDLQGRASRNDDLESQLRHLQHTLEAVQSREQENTHLITQLQTERDQLSSIELQQKGEIQRLTRQIENLQRQSKISSLSTTMLGSGSGGLNGFTSSLGTLPPLRGGGSLVSLTSPMSSSSSSLMNSSTSSSSSSSSSSLASSSIPHPKI